MKVLVENGRAYFGFDEADYLSVAAWLQDMLRFVKAQNAVIEAYEDRPDE